MAADNTLGAPTEGLGQTVTFAGGQGRAEPQTPTIQRQSLRAGESGGTATRTAEALRTPDPVGNTIFQTLARFGGEILKPKLEAERALSFAKGMQQAAQGQAITEIVEEQPWYSQAFGSTSLVDGARAYSAAAKATAVATDIEANMNEVRRLSANEVSQYVADKMLGAAKTGDATTDAMIMHQVTQTIPSVLKSQAKAHLVYQQELMSTSIRDNALANGAMLKAMDTNSRKDGATVDPLDMQIAEINFTETLRKPDDMRKEVHDELIVSSTEAMIVDGNFRVYDVLEKSGKLNDLTPQQRYTLRRAKAQASTQAKADLPIEFMRKSFEWYASSGKGATEQEMIDGRAALNAEYTRLTGDSTPYLGNPELIRELLQRDAAEARANKPTALQTQNDKERAQLVEDLGIVGDLLTPGRVSLANLEPKQRQRVLDLAAEKLPVDKRMEVLAIQSEVGVIDKRMQETMQARSLSAIRRNSPMDLQTAYQEFFLPMVKAGGGRGDVVAMEYAGKEVGDVLMAWHLASGGQPVDAVNAPQVYDLTVERRPAKLEGKVDEAIVKELSSGRTMKSLYAVGRVFGGDDYAIENPRYAASLIKKYMPINEPDMEKATEIALRRAKDNDVSEVGGYVWLRGPTESRLETYLSNAKLNEGASTKDSYNKVTRTVIKDVVSEIGIADEVTVGQLQDGPNGVPRIYVSGLSADGKFRSMLLSGDDIVKRSRAIAKGPEVIVPPVNYVKGYPDSPPLARNPLTIK